MGQLRRTAALAASLALVLAACGDEAGELATEPGTEAEFAALAATPVYGDALAAGWADWSWATRNLASRATVESGTRSIAVTYGPWRGLYFRHGAGRSTAGLTHLELSVNGGATAGPVLAASVYVGSTQRTKVRIAQYCTGGTIPARAWTRCRIPLSALKASNVVINGIVLQEFAGRSLPVLYVDRVDLTDGAPPPPPPTLPAAPGGLVATPSSADVALAWNAVTGASGYQVYRASSATGTLSRLSSAPLTARTYRDTGVVAGSTYWYAVSAVNAAGEGARSPRVSATVPATPPPPPPAPPAAPGGLVATPSAADVSLAWNAVAGATGYHVHRATSATGTFSRLSSAPLADRTYSDVAVAAGSTYWYAVSAVNAAGEGARSAAVSATVPVVPPPPPPPTGVASEIVPVDRRTVWAPGIPGGVPEVTAVHATLNAASYGNGSTDATSAIESALSAAASTAASTGVRQVVALSAGTFRIARTLNLAGSDVVLRGAGPGSTFLQAAGNRAIWIGEVFPDHASTRAIDVVGSVAKGARSITVADASTIQPGDVLQLDEVEDNGGDPLGGNGGWVFRFDIWWSMRVPYAQYPNMGVEGNGPDSPSGHRPVAQLVEVASKSGNTLTLTNTVHLPFPATLKPQVWDTRAGRIRYAGLEDLTVRGGRDDMIIMGSSSYSWIRNVESDGSSGGFYGRHVVVGGFRNVLRDSYIHHSTNYNPGGNAYGIVFTGTDCLIENNIAYLLNKPIAGETSGGGNVIAYNYVDEAVLGSPTGTWQEHAISASHGSFSHSNLFEGNWSPNVGTDSTHGNNGWNVIFRNHATGRNGSGRTTGPLRAIGIDGRSREHTSIGNVLLTAPGLATNARLMGTPSAQTSPDTPVVYLLGANSWDANGNMAFDIWDDGMTLSFFRRHLDFDNLSNAIYYDPSNPVTALPSSLYLTAKPAFFGANPWPWVDPLGSTHADRVRVLPAKARFDAM